MIDEERWITKFKARRLNKLVSPNAWKVYVLLRNGIAHDEVAGDRAHTRWQIVTCASISYLAGKLELSERIIKAAWAQLADRGWIKVGHHHQYDVGIYYVGHDTDTNGNQRFYAEEPLEDGEEA